MEPRALLSATVTRFGDIGYFASSSGPQIQRYDTVNETWLSPINLSGATQAPSVIHLDNDGLYVAYGKSVSRYLLDGTSPTHLINTQYDVIGIHSDGNVLFLNQSSGLYARFLSINKTTNQLIDTIENYVDSVGGSSISMSANRIIGRSQGVSPSDITFVSYGDDGQFTGGGDSPYHGDYPGASTTWMFPGGSKVVDDSGTVYSASSLTRLNSFGSTVTDMVFLGNDVPIVLSGNKITAYTSGILPSGSAQLSDSPSNIFVNQTHVITFKPDATTATGFRVGLVNLSTLNPATPGQPVNPVGLKYTPNKIETMADGKTLIYSQSHQSLFIWDAQTQGYSQSIPLVDTADYMAYSATTNTAYLAYSSGLIRKLDLSSANPVEVPFATLPQSPLGLSVAGQYLFAVDGSGAWVSHYTFRPDGTLVEAVDWNYYSTEYLWNDTNQKMYFFRDDTSPNDLLSEEINANGSAYAGEPAGGIRGKIDSPLHGADGFQHPIRVSPDGKIVVLGSGVIHDAKTLTRSPYSLSNSISDATWIGNELFTIRNMGGVAQLQKWQQPTFGVTKSAQVFGTANRLLSLPNDRLLAITTGTDGIPAFTIFDLNLASDDHTAPSLSITPNGTTTDGSPITFTFQFSEVVTGFTTSDVVLTNGTGGTFTAVDGDTYTLVVIPNSNGVVGVTVADSAAQDAATKGSTSAEASVISDPTVPSLKISPDNTTTSSSPIIFTFQFSEVVTEFTLSDIQLTNGSVSEFAAVDGDTYTLKVIPQSDGLVSVSVLANAANDVSLNASLSANASVTSDTHPPHATAFTAVSEGVINFSSASWTLDFSESVTGVDATDFALLADGITGAAITSVTGSGKNYVVTASTGSGNGTLGIKLNDNDSIVDTSLRPLVGSANSDGSLIGGSYEFSHVALSLLSIERWFQGNGVTNDDELSFRVTFSEPVTAVDPADFLVKGETTATVTEVHMLEETGGVVFEVIVSGGDLASYNGPVGLNLSRSQNITDEAGNRLPTTEPSVDQSYQLDDTLTEYFLRQVKEINLFGNSDPRDFTVIGNTLYFTADDGVHGRELWKTNGTKPTTVMVKDIDPGEYGSEPLGLTNLNGVLYFFVGSQAEKTELWKSNGTAAGTVLVKTISSDIWIEDLELPGTIAVSNRTLFFSGWDGEHGQELWKSDGTAKGTKLIKEISVDSYWSGPSNLIDVNGTLFFTSDDDNHGLELWKSNGTAAGTVMVTDLKPGPDSTFFADSDHFVAVNNTLYFVANNGSSGMELWRSDGTAMGTRLVKDIFPGSGGANVEELTNVNGTLYFSAYTDEHGQELWKSDGTSSGTVRLTDVTEGSGSLMPTQLTTLNGTLFFLGEGGQGGRRLWKSDGTSAGTVLAFDELPDFEFDFNCLAVAGGKLVVTIRGFGMLVTDGTEVGTTFVSGEFDQIGSDDDDSHSRTVAVLNDTLMFASSEVSGGELFRIITTPPHPTEPHLLIDTNPEEADGYVFQFDSIGPTAIFRSSSQDGRTIWKSDGTTAGTQVVKEFSGEDDVEAEFSMAQAKGFTFFPENDGEHGFELWKSDGTENGTVLVKDISTEGNYQGIASSFPRQLTAVNDNVFFVANAGYQDDGYVGDSLWKTDGTSAGTVMVKDLISGEGDPQFANFTSLNGRLFFTAYDDIHGRGLWKSDGTPAGTQLVKEIGGSESNFIIVNGTLFFTTDGQDGQQLWKSDGTTGGTKRIATLDGSITDLTPVGKSLLFVHNEALWRSDGTSAGTKLVTTAAFEPMDLTSIGNVVYFSAVTEESGRELWKSDGTAKGTVLVKDINTGYVDSNPYGFVNLGGSIYFTAIDSRGAELWRTDGTAKGTFIVGNLKREDGYYNDGSDPSSLTVIGNSMYFTANDGVHGRKVWIVQGPDAIAPKATSIQRTQIGSVDDESVRWKVVFSEPVRGVSLDDFQLVGKGLAGAAITSFVGSGTTYFVTTTAGADTGTLGLRLLDNNSIHDLSGNLLANSLTSSVVAADRIAPSTVSFLRQTPNSPFGFGETVVFRATFSETVESIDVTDFVVNGATTASVTAVKEVAGSGGKSFDVTVSGGDLASLNGLVGLNLSPSQDVTDTSGNVLPTTEPTNDQSFVMSSLQSLTYQATGDAVLTVRVVKGLLTVTIGGVLQPAVNPAAVESLTLIGGSKNDSIVLAGLLSSQYSRLSGIVISGGDGNDLITGSMFAETISGGLGNDSLTGGRGTDLLVETGDISFVLTNKRLTGLGTDSLAGFELASLTGGDHANKLDATGFTGNVSLVGGDGNDTLIGGSGLDTLLGELGDDSLNGAAGNDTLNGGAGGDSLQGGAGNDTLNGDEGGDEGDDEREDIDVVVESANVNLTLTDLSLLGLGMDWLRNIESASLTGGAGHNKLTATAFTLGSVTLIGGAGNDTIQGGSHHDSIDGGVGNDALMGNFGNDVLFGGAGKDTLLGGIDDDSLFGGQHDDVLIGGFGEDLLNGEEGNDKFTGGQGADGEPRYGNSTANYGDVIDNVGGEIVDETIATLFPFESPG